MFVMSTGLMFWLMECSRNCEFSIWENGTLAHRTYRNGAVYFRQNRMDVAVGAMVADY